MISRRNWMDNAVLLNQKWRKPATTAAVKRVFDVLGRTTSAAKQLMTIRQGARTVADYSIEFRTLAAEVGWNNEALVAAYSQGLCDAIKDETTARELPGDLEELISVTILIDTRIHERFYQNILIMDPVTILLSIVVGLFLIIVLKGDKRNVYKNFPPGPKPLPVIGNLHIINRIKPQKTFMELYKKFGSVFSIQLGTEKIVVLCGYETVKDALVNHAEEFSERANIPIFEMVAKGYGIVFSRGENWKVMRRFALSTLRDFGMGKKSIENKINEESDYLVQKFKSYKGKPFENNIIMNSAVANIIVSITLGHRFEYEDSTLLKIVNKINKMVRLQGSRMVKLYNMYPSVTRWLPGSHNTIIGNAEEIQKFIKETFTKRKKQLDINDQRDLIDAFLVKQLEEKPHPGLYFHDNNLAVLVFSLLTAGMETTSTTLRWGFLLMMKYPEIQKNVQNEIEKVIGSAQPQAEHRKQMPYTDAVIHEIQRFADIVPLNLPHATTQDVTFRGYFIPKGTQVIPLLTSVLKDEDHFERPNEFYPQHFLDSEGNFVKNEAFIPFSAGRRMCVGETLAKMELFLFFTRLLQSFTFQLPPGAELHLNFETGLTSMPLFHEMCAVPRT
ncbi:cytochrome P450 2K1-like [Rhinophrynus dorsalis]